jgi:nicotinamidase-related amidase
MEVRVMDDQPVWRPRRESTALLVVDMQVKLLPVMRDADAVIARIAMMIAGARALGVPALATEQNPEGLGATLPSLSEGLTTPALTKRSFSCFGAEGFQQELIDRSIETLVIAGIEAHICVLATALEARERGYRVLVARDAVTTRLATTEAPAWDRMTGAGVEATSAEAFLFEMMEGCDDPAFREILGLVREAR